MKKLLLGLFAVAAAMGVKAYDFSEYAIYWMANNDTGIEANTAYLFASVEGSSEDIYIGGKGLVSDGLGSYSTGELSSSLSVLGTSFAEDASFTFFVEYYNESTYQMRSTYEYESMSLADLLQAGYLKRENDISPVSHTAAMSFTAAVPEPTSGLLLLIGLAGLSLKRKRLA